MVLYRINSIHKKVFFFLLISILTCNLLFSQNPHDLSDPFVVVKDSLNRVYGLDPVLYNGIIYASVYPKNVKGDQYFSSINYVRGEATIRGIKYKNLDLNYDIYKQELLLKYLNPNNSYNIIMISKAWLEGFSIGNVNFEFYSTPEIPRRIYQVLGVYSIRLLYYNKKVLQLNNAAGSTSFYFLPVKELFVLMDNSILKFHNNRSFIHLFAPEKQPIIKKYLRKNRIKVSRATDNVMEELINFCSK